ncbi:MAG: Uma2 family endonuclease [bacterium]
MTERSPIYGGYTVSAYFELVNQGLLSGDDHVELLDGVIVSEPPMDPPHATGIEATGHVLRRALEGLAWVREQKPMVIGDTSVPEPDLAVLGGSFRDYDGRHPTTALLVVEVSDSSLPQDRLSKSRIYAGAGIADYWIVNVRQECLEVYREPDATQRVYASRWTMQRGEHVSLVAFPTVSIAVNDLLPWPARRRDD